MTTLAAIIMGRAVQAQTPEPPERPPFLTSMGGLAQGEIIPDIRVLNLGNEEVALRELMKGPTLLVLWTAQPGLDEQSIEFLNRLAREYRRQNLALLAVATLSEREDFDRWVRTNKDHCSFEVLFDPSGPLPPEPDKPMNEYTQEELVAMAQAWRAVADRSISGQIANSGPPLPEGRYWGIPGMPAVVVFDENKRLVGMTSVGAPDRPGGAPRAMAEDTNGLEGLGNLLIFAGIEPLPQDRPTRVFTAQMVEAYHQYVAAERERQRAGRVALLSIGAMAPDFQMVDGEGKPVKLSDFRGRTVILDFWATWCGPCIASMPEMQKLAKQYQDQGLVVLASGTDDAVAAFKKWIGRNADKYPDILFAYDPLGREPHRASQSRYGVAGLPTQFIIDSEGRIVGRTFGLSPGGGSETAEYYLSKAGLNVDPDIVTAGAKRAAAMEQSLSRLTSPGQTRVMSAPPPGADIKPAKSVDEAASEGDESLD